MLDRQDLFCGIREALAAAFPNRGRAHLLAHDAGIDLTRVDLAGAPAVFWQAILEEAERQGKVETLLDAAITQAPACADLPALLAEYRGLRRAGPPRAPSPPDGDEPQPKTGSPGQKRAPTPRLLWLAVVGLLAVIVCAVVKISSPCGTPIPPMPGMVCVPAGEFTMGSADGDVDANDGEKPQHKVYVKGFWISRTEVTNAQYADCVKAGACAAPDNEDYIRAEFAQWPVTDVTWYNANKYAAWVGGRLPTEAEWEKACRGTDGLIYPWGNAAPTDEHLNFNHPTNGVVKDVGSYPKGRSPYGALDMAGNVWEWTSSELRDYPYRADDGREVPNRANRVLRGGAFYDVAENVRCAVRIADSFGSSYKGFGFRVVTSLVE